jgi:hypothetical protein
MRLSLALLALAGAGCFLWLARRPPELHGKPTRLRVLGARAIQGLYLVSAAALLVRAIFGLTTPPG